MFAAPYHHLRQTIFIKTGLSQISLTPGFDKNKNLFHIIQAICNLDEKVPFEEHYITAGYDNKPFTTLNDLYLYCRAEQATWEVNDEQPDSIYDKYDAIEIAEGWGKLADIIMHLGSHQK